MTKLKITQVRSRNGADKRQLATLRSLGLHRIGQTVQREDDEPTRGMVHSIQHLLKVDK